MKTIEEAALEYAEPIATYTYFKGMDDLTYYDLEKCMSDSFKAGADFAQRWISIDEELPPVSQQVIVKLKNNWHACTWLLGDGTFAYNINPTHWRPIELK